MSANPFAINFICALLLGSTSLAVPEDPVEFAEWEARINQIVEDQRTLPPEVAIPRLGDIVGKLADDNEPRLRESKAFKAAKSQLLEIPGYAEYFGSEIKRLTDAEINGTSKEHSLQRGFYFHVLGELPSVETVQVLGDLLFDVRDPFKSDLPNDSPWIPNSVNATYTFYGLGLKNPPIGGKKGDAHEDVPTWQAWFESIRTGKQNFSFKGDDKIYSINGPVGKEAPRRAKQENKRSLAIDKRNPESPSLFAAIVFLVLLILAATGLWLKQKKN